MSGELPVVTGSLRVLCVASSYPRTPADFAGSFVRTGLLALAARGHRVTVVHPHPGTDVELCDDPEIRRVAVRIGLARSSLAYRGGMPERLAAHPLAWAEAPRLVARLGAAAVESAGEHDVLLSHWLVPGGWVGAHVRRRTGLPHVCVLHSGGVGLLATLPGGALVARRIAGACDRFVAVSESVAARMARLTGSPAFLRAEVVPNPLPDSAFEVPARRGRNGVLFVGRLEEVKGVGTLLDALRPTDPFGVTIAGAGSLEPALRETATRRGLPVRFVGVVDPAERSRLLARTRLLVVPSIVLPGGRTEGAPTVVAEALAAGVPVVASRVGGLPDMIEDGVTGALVPPGDPAALRDALRRALTWDAAARGTACRDQAQRYRSDRFAASMECVLVASLETSAA